MTTRAVTSTRTFVVERDINCRGCGYNLRGLHSTGDCPECGDPISVSLIDTMDNFLRGLPREASRNLRVEVLHEPLGLWITLWPLLICIAFLCTSVIIGIMQGPWGIFTGIAIGVIGTSLFGHRMILWRERKAIDRYLTTHCHDCHLNRCPLCYHDLSGDLTDLCPECGCPVCVRKIV